MITEGIGSLATDCGGKEHIGYVIRASELVPFTEKINTKIESGTNRKPQGVKPLGRTARNKNESNVKRHPQREITRRMPFDVVNWILTVSPPAALRPALSGPPR